jgi:hypothetical protein
MYYIMPPKTKKRVKKSRKAQAPKIQPSTGKKHPIPSAADMSWTEPAKDEPTKDVANPLAQWRDASMRARAKTGHKGMICKGSDCYKEAKNIMQSQKKAVKLAPIIAKSKGK